MSLVFDALIDTYLETEVGQSRDFLSLDLLLGLKSNLLQLEDNEQLRQAGIGLSDSYQQDVLYRKDKIFWLESETENEFEIEFQKQISAFILYLNQTCFTGITNSEFHYALYEPGSFYKRHFDQFAQNDSRVFSIIIYLNPDWISGDGGELMVYHADSEQKINPINGRMIFFDSAKLAHEVLETRVARRSIVGWLRRD